MTEERRFASGWKDYELIDAGGGKKLERWGEIVTIRPELQAYFRSGKPFSEWKKMAHWEFVQGKGQTGKWKSIKEEAPEEWNIQYKRLTIKLALTKFKHLGLFPEQVSNWKLLSKRIHPGDNVLNLFAYTGVASCVSKQAGADVIHVDSVKQLITWAKENMEESGLDGIRWVHEDALKFAKKERKRGHQYDFIIMDPPAWGIGPKGERWKLENKLEELFEITSGLLKKEGTLILNTYSPKVKLDFIGSLANKYFSKRYFELEELWMKTTTGKELFFGNLLRVLD